MFWMRAPGSQLRDNGFVRSLAHGCARCGRRCRALKLSVSRFAPGRANSTRCLRRCGAPSNGQTTLSLDTDLSHRLAYSIRHLLAQHVRRTPAVSDRSALSFLKHALLRASVRATGLRLQHSLCTRAQRRKPRGAQCADGFSRCWMRCGTSYSAALNYLPATSALRSIKQRAVVSLALAVAGSLSGFIMSIKRANADSMLRWQQLARLNTALA